MLYFSNAKINLGLNIISKRSDGFHNIESVFYPVYPQDAIEFIPKKETKLSQSGIIIEGNENDNLIIKAYQLLKKKYELPPLHFHILKNIPFGAGLGAGSANAAYTINAINDFFELNISTKDRQRIAMELGSDCAFFIENKAIFASGKGEILQNIKLDLSDFEIIIIHPNFSISTQEAYANISPKAPKESIKDIIDSPISEWKNRLVNDFEEALFKKYPILPEIKNELYKQGALYAAMSGSGSAVFGIFEKVPQKLSFSNFWTWKGKLHL